jgi:hypothetical protein
LTARYTAIRRTLTGNLNGWLKSLTSIYSQ